MQGVDCHPRCYVAMPLDMLLFSLYDAAAILQHRSPFRQLATQPAAYSLVRHPSPDPLQSLPEQLFEAREFARLNNDPKHLKILEWAIECERNSSPHVLEAIRERAYEWFRTLPGNADA